MTVDDLNQRFGIFEQVVFQAGQGGLSKININNQFATAEIYLLGGHVTAYQPHGQAPVLWMSDICQFQVGTPIRGGIPVIWPWFGPHPHDDDKPQHGFVRSMLWQVDNTEALADGQTCIALSLNDDVSTQAIWPHTFSLTLQITVGETLQVSLISTNRGDETLDGLGAALHTYFTVGDVAQIAIEGLTGRDYLSKVESYVRKTQQGAITFGSEVDRIYLDTTDVCLIRDPVLQRTMRVSKEGSQSTVVWNPWIDKAQAMADFPDDGYSGMVCVETTRAANDLYSLAPGQSHTLTQIVSVE